MSAPIHGVLQKDDNGYTVAGGVSSVNPVLVLNAEIDPSTGRLLVNAGGSGASLSVTDGTTTVTGVTIVDFTSGATVTNGGGGTVDVAITGGGGLGYQAPLTGGITGTNTWTTAPNVIVVDGVSKQKTSTDGTVNWTGTTTTVLSVTPTFDVFASA